MKVKEDNVPGIVSKKDDNSFIVRIVPRRFINIYTYTALLSIVQFWYSFYLAYTIAALSTLERRYGMPSLYSGIFLACFEIGHLTIIVFSFTETNCHIPQRLAIRGFFMSIGAFLMASPHILVPVASDADRLQQQSWTDDNKQNSTSNQSALKCFDPDYHKPLRNCTSEEIDAELALMTKGAGEAVWALAILTFAQCIVATASSTYCVIGVLFIDNNVDKEHSSAYIGTVYSMMMLGPAAAFFFSSGVAGSIYVHPFENNSPDPNSAHFVGAWWSGFLLSSAMFLIVSPLFLLFPIKFEKKECQQDNDESQTMSKNSTIKSIADVLNNSNCDSLATTKALLSTEVSVTPSSASTSPENDADSDPFTIKTIPKNFVILFRNTVFLALVFLACAQIYITAGYFTFFPKYIEAQFRQPVWVANLVSGIANPIPCAVGTFLGGFLMSKLKISQSNALLCTFVLATLVAIGLLFMSGLQCEPERIIGLDLRQQFYDEQSSFIVNNIQTNCQNRCDVCPKRFDPVCGSDGNTYASACHAGCLFFDLENKTYINCGCVGDSNSNSTTGGTAIPEKCKPARFSDRFCKSFVIYIVLAFILAVLIILPSTPMLICMMRCVGPRYKSWAIGLTSSFCSFLSFIPAPVIFGSVFDSHCLLWDEQSTGFQLLANSEYSRCDTSVIKSDGKLISSLQADLLENAASPHNCILYETKSLAVWFHVITSTFLFISLPANAYVWWKFRENERELKGSTSERFSTIRDSNELTAATEI